MTRTNTAAHGAIPARRTLLSRLLSRLWTPADPAQPSVPPRAARARMESLEPRLLLAADGIVGGITDSMVAGMTAVSSAIEQAIVEDSTFETLVPGILVTERNGNDVDLVSTTVEKLLKIEVDLDQDDGDPHAESFVDLSGASLAERFDAIADGDVLHPFDFDDARQMERVLDALDIDGDEVVSWKEAFDVLVVGQIEDFFGNLFFLDLNDLPDFLNAMELPLDGGFGSPLDDFFELSVDNAALPGDPVEGEFRVSFDVTFNLIQRQPVYLGLEGDRHEILSIVAENNLLNGSTSDDTVDTPTVSVKRGVTVDNFTFGFNGIEDTDPEVTEADFFFATDGARVGIDADETDSFSVRIGFLGGEVSNGSFLLDMGATTQADDPSNPDALGFEPSQQGVQDPDGEVAANEVPTLSLDHDIVFSLKVGTHDVGPVEVTLPAGDYADEATLADAVQDAIDGAGLAGLLTVAVDVDDKLVISLMATDPGPLGFAAERFSGSGELIGDFDPTIVGTENDDPIAFLLSVEGAQPVVITVTPTLVDHDGDGGTPEVVTLAQLAADLDAALALAGVAVSAQVDGTRLKLVADSGTPTLEISRTLTLDTVDEITIEELESAEVFTAAEPESDAALQIDWEVTVTAGLGWNPDAATLHVDIDPWDSDDVDEGAVEGQRRASFALESQVVQDGAYVALDDPSSEFAPLLDFNVVNAAEVAGLFGQLATFSEQLANSDLLNKFGIPFVQGDLGDVLDFDDLLRDTLLMDDLDNDDESDDVAKLLGIINEQVTVRFDTAQELALALDAILDASAADIAAHFDPDTKELTYNLELEHDFLEITKPIDFNLDLGTLAGVVTQGSVRIGSTGRFNAKVGLRLGDVFGPLESDTELFTLNGGKGVKIMDHIAVTTGGAIDAIVGRLTTDAHFNVVLDKGGTITSTPVTVYRVIPVDPPVVTAQTGSDDNREIGDLVDDINDALEDAGLDGDVVAEAEAGRVVLRALSGVDRFWITSNTSDAAAKELGLVPQTAATVSVMGSAPVQDVTPGADVTLEFSVNRNGATEDVVVSVLTAATDANPSNTNGNFTITDLVYDINQALLASDLSGEIVAVRSGNRIVFAAAAHDIDAFSVEVTAGGNDIGFDLSAERTRLKELGLDDTAANAIDAFVAGPVALGATKPGSPFGRLTSDAVVSIALDGGAAVDVTIDDADTAANASLSDLVVSINEAINLETDLVGKVVASTDGVRLLFRTIDASIEQLAVTAGAGADQLGLSGTVTATAPLRAVASKLAPTSYGVNEDAHFTVEVVDSDLGTYSEDVTLLGVDTIKNATIYQLAASLNNALNTAFGGPGHSPIMASVQAGAIVFSLRTTAGPGDPTAPLAPVAANVTAFSITADAGDSAVTQLKVHQFGDDSPAGTVTLDANDADLLIVTSEGDHFTVSLDHLLLDGGDPGNDPDGTIAGVLQAINDAAAAHPETLDVTAEIGADGASLTLKQGPGIALGSTQFRVELVNGSPAGLGLGLFGTDTVTTDVAESNPQDGVIEGSRIATVRAVDRFFLEQSGDVLSADLTASIDELTAEATFGFVGIALSSGATDLFKATGGIGIADGDDNITLGELLDASGSNGSILKIRELLDLPTFDVDAADDFFELDVALEPLSDLIDLGVAPKLKLTITDLGGLSDTSGGVQAVAPKIDVAELDIGDLANFGGIGFDDVITSLQSVADFLQQFDSFSFLSDPIPLVGKSVNDVLDVADRFAQALSDIRGAASGKFAMLGAPTVTFTDVVGGNDTIARNVGSWVTDGFAAGQLVTVSGSQTDNDGTFRIVRVTDKVLTLSPDDALTDETVSGWTQPEQLRITAGSNGANNAQVLAQRISEAFGIPVFPNHAARDAYFQNIGIPVSDATDLIQFALESLNGGTNNMLRFDLRLPVGFSQGLPVQLDLGDVQFLEGLPIPVELSGSAGLKLTGFLDAKLSFGIDLDNPTDVYLFDDATSVEGKLQASANNLTFNVSVGPLGAFIKDGNASIALDFSYANGSADPDPELIADLGAILADFDPSLTGNVSATLPVYAPTESSFVGDIALAIPNIELLEFTPLLPGLSDFGLGQGGNPLDLANLGDFITLPDFSGIDLSQIDPFSSIGSLLDALDTFLAGIQDVLDGEVFGFELPFIGDQLSAGADFIEDLRRDVLAPIRQYVDQAPELAQDLVQHLLFSLLGPGSEVLDQNGITLVNGDSLQEFLGLGAAIDGLGLLRKLSDGSAIPGVFSDLDQFVRADDLDGDGFQWQVRLGQTFSPPVDIAFDLGFDALGLAMDTSLEVDFLWDLAFGVGLSKQDGAFILVGAEDFTTGDGNGREVNGEFVDDELFLSVDVALPAGSTLLHGKLGFLQLDITPIDDDFDGDSQDDPTHFHADFSIDLINGSDAGDQRLGFSELGNLDADIDANADAEVNLEVVAQFNEDLLGEDVAAFLPAVSTNFVLDWELDGIISGGFDLGDSLKYLAFEDVTIDLGSFLGKTLGPVIDQIQEVTGPLQPIIDVITAPIPVISELAGKPISLVDIAGLTGYVEPAMIYAIADLITLVNSIPASPQSLAIGIGTFVLVNADDPGFDPNLGNALSDPNFSLGEDSSLFNLGDKLPAGFQDTLDGFRDLFPSSLTSNDTEDAANGLFDGAESGQSGFGFPIFEKPSSIFGLLLGRDVALITYDLAPFGMNFSYTQKFPIWGPLWASITGAASLTVDLAFGYDTAGIREFVEGDFENPLDLIGGFYVSDTDLPEGTGGTDVPELVLSGELFAGAEINLGVASAGVEGGVILTVNFDLYDPDRDGRVRLEELFGNVLYEFKFGNPALAPIAIFDVFGDVAAQLRAYIEFLFIKKTFEITPPITLFEFSIPFERQPHLATERGDGSLLINVGPYAESRTNGDTRDIGETIFVKSTSSDTVLVWSGQFNVDEGGAQEYHLGDSKEIVIIGGNGDDTINVAGVTHSGIKLRIEGGTGNDTIVLGDDSVGASIEAGDGDDTITGGGAADIIFGGLGNDIIRGGGAADVIFGDTGTYRPAEAGDSIPGRIRSIAGAKDGNDDIDGQDGGDIVFGGGGFDLIHGGADDDLLFGDGGFFDFASGNAVPTGAGGRVDIAAMNARGLGAKDRIFGDAGNDTGLGGAGDDIMDGGAGTDQMLGGDGFDSIYGGGGGDFLYGEAHDDTIFGLRDPTAPAGDFDGADADPDGEDTIEGNDGNDFIRGNDAHDVAYGGRGADIMFGDAGDDELYGEAGPDIVFGGADGDFIDAGDSNDIVFGDDGLVVYQGFYAPSAVADLIAAREVVDAADFGSLIRADQTTGDRLVGDGDEATLIDGFVGDGLRTTQDLFVTKPLATDGSDNIVGGDGKDVAFGGGGLLDTLYGDFDPASPPAGPRPSGQDLLIGDGGRVELLQRRYSVARAVSDALDGVDHISGNDHGDYIFGGGNQDVLHGFEDAGLFDNLPLEAVDDNDVILGDNGQIDFDTTAPSNRIEKISTTFVAGDSGASDVAFGNFGSDVILGGLNSSADVLNGDDGNDVILGDQGALYFQDDPGTLEDEGDGDLDTLDLVRSFRDGVGGGDIISGSAGFDVLIGGTAGDTMYGDDATASHGADDLQDVMLGDNADVVLEGLQGQLLVQVAAMPQATAVRVIRTTDDDETKGGADTMSGNAGGDIMLGGVNNDDGIDPPEIDRLYGDADDPVPGLDGKDVLLGDNGELDFGADADLLSLDFIVSYEDGLGGSDELSGSALADAAIGGTGDDVIYGDDEEASAAALDDADMLLGDNAVVQLIAGEVSGGDAIPLLGGTVEILRTTDQAHPEYGGEDTISGNAGGDIIAGGVQGDTLYGDALSVVDALDGDDIILGDNGQLEWLSAGRLLEIDDLATLEEINPALVAHFEQTDDDLTTLDLITTEQPASGARDVIYGDNGQDVAFGGTDADTIYGDDGDETGDAANNDVLFGDHGRIYPHFSALASFPSRNFFAIDIGDGDGGEGDRMWGEEGADTMLGQQGDDRMFGGSGDDDMTGGHNIEGGVDELSGPAISATLNPPVNDLMDGGSGDDSMAGDNAQIWRRGDDLSPRFRQLTDTLIYTTGEASITANVGGDPQSDPEDAVGRDIKLLDHSDTTPLGRFGNDVMAGGSNRFENGSATGGDTMFGQLGDDLMQGDGAIGTSAEGAVTFEISVSDAGSDPDTDETLQFNVPEAATDGNDYLEGNGGNDRMYGGLGQDDLIGGSSALFGLDDDDPIAANALRPDGADIIFGGAGVRIGRNDEGDPASLGHARDADFVMGDNANVYRLVNAADQFLTFAYDNYAGTLRLVPRAMQQLDYTLGGPDWVGGTPNSLGQAPGDNGTGDLIHGEDGDDVIFGMTGDDVIFANAQDDDVVGGYGHDWISGGTGQDGVVGDDGLLYTSRNGVAEPLYGVAATVEDTITTPGNIQTALINQDGELKKTAELVPFSVDQDWNATDDEFFDTAGDIPYADDIIFGGLGSDFLHGGSGDDAISGAEALREAFVVLGYDADGDPIGVLDLGYDAVGLPAPVNPGDVLFFNPEDTDGQHLNNRFRAGEFPLYDEYNALRKVLLTGTGELWKPEIGGPQFEFLLNFDETEGVFQDGGTVPKGEPYGAVYDDGNDAIFGDLGNDWLVGGTGRDNLYGGWGNDLLNADDNHDTTWDGADPTANDTPDTHPTYEDRAYGGAGRDVLIGNTGGDRLIDWVGEYNSYLVPFAPFGMATVSRTLQPFLPEFLYALSAADGADPTRDVDEGRPGDDPRNGEPAGELGLVLQKDFAWQDQTGAPADPQAGNIPGGKRDVLRSADFNNTQQANGFMVDSGTWTMASGRYSVAAGGLGNDAVSVNHVDQFLPSYYEVLATVNANKPTATAKGTGYIIFDYQSETDFKFAGIDVSTNKVVIGHRAAGGWAVDASTNAQLRGNSDYNLKLAVNGTAVTLIVDNKHTVSHVFAPRVVDGENVGLNTGMLGLGAENSATAFDNFMVQRLAPVTTFEATNEFDGTVSPVTLAPITGSWTVDGGRYGGVPVTDGAALSLTPLEISAGSLLVLETRLSSAATGGLAFDAYADDDFKFVALSPGGDQLLIGHRTHRGWTTDQVVALSLADGADHTLTVTLAGTTVSVTANGKLAASHAFNGLVTDGDFGLLSRNGASSFERLTVKTDDPAYAGGAVALLATTQGAGGQAALSASAIAAIENEAIARWDASGLIDVGVLGDVRFAVTDLPGRGLGLAVGRTVLLDRDAAGHGWFVDSTPDVDQEFGPGQVPEVLLAPVGSPAFGRIDLLTALAHELGHMAGQDHDGLAVMRVSLAVNERVADFTAKAFAPPEPPPLVKSDHSTAVHYFDHELAALRRAPAPQLNEIAPAFYYERATASLLPADESAAKESDAKKVQIDWRGGLKSAAKSAAFETLQKLKAGPNASIRLR